MTFAIVAELPLGTYRGNEQDGRAERLPSVARLHAALLCAAGFGPRAVPLPEGDFGPCEADEVALRWLEVNPPDGVHIPALEVASSRVAAYRSDGTIKKSKSTLAIKKFAKDPLAGTSVGGRFVWMWREQPPPAVRAAFGALCPDVPYLGTTESPVRLTTVDGEVEVSHERDASAGMFSVGIQPIDRPLPGRMGELTAVHAAATGTPPSVSRDKYKTDEWSQSEVPTREGVEAARYRAREAVTGDVPWSQVVLLPLSGGIEERDRVVWAVAVHRALVRLIGEGAPSLVTGYYPDGARRPANRVALHMLARDMPVANGAAAAPATLAVLIPRDADPADVGILFEALDAMTSFRGPRGHVKRVDQQAAEVLNGDGFWREPAPGQMRLWRTVPAAVPDNRGAGGQEWTFVDAALLSLAFVWKDALPAVGGRRDVYYRGMAAAVAERGAAVVHVSALRQPDVNRFVHKVNDHAVVRPYRACLWLGGLAGPQTVLAIGQSRHLGGGLLVPFDVDEGTPLHAARLPIHRPAANHGEREPGARS